MPQIRPAEPEDLEPIMVLVRACIAGMRALGIDQWDEIYPDAETINADVRSGTAFVALQTSELLGFVALNDHQDPEYADVPWTISGRPGVIHRLMVSPSREGRGVGRALMRFAEERAASLGYRCIRLDAFCENPRAQHFYEQDEYRRAGRVRFRKGDFDCFEKPLGEAVQPAVADGRGPRLRSEPRR